MSKLKLKINVKLPQLLCIVVSVALNGEFARFGGFALTVTTYSRRVFLALLRAHASRSPRFRLCSPKIRKKNTPVQFCRLSCFFCSLLLFCGNFFFRNFVLPSMFLHDREIYTWIACLAGVEEEGEGKKTSAYGFSLPFYGLSRRLALGQILLVF